MKLTKTELVWMLHMVKENRERSQALKDWPGQKYAVFHALEYENMRCLADKLEWILENNAKRITIS